MNPRVPEASWSEQDLFPQYASLFGGRWWTIVLIRPSYRRWKPLQAPPQQPQRIIFSNLTWPYRLWCQPTGLFQGYRELRSH